MRLVHGYNMRDCMRIKGYEVELVADTRDTPNSPINQSSNQPSPGRYQLWRLVSETGDVSIWSTVMLRAGDFSETGVDCRSMAFPRIGIPDDPRWMPEGITVKSFRHPVRNFRMMLRAKWNKSRRDLGTFLRLKQPAWASDEMLTLVGVSGGGTVPRESEPDVARDVLDAQGFLLRELQAWRGRKTEGPQE